MRRWWWGGLVMVLIHALALASPVAADCGPGAPDTDGDGVCDDADPCASPAPPLREVTLRMKGFATAAVDDGFRLDGVLTPATSVDPTVTGLSIALSNEFIGPFALATIPGGAGWRRAARGGASFGDAAGTYGGITRVRIKPRGDGTLVFSIAGRRREYAASTGIVPIRVAVALGAPQATPAECGEAFLSPSRCIFPASGNSMRCVPPPTARRCGEDPDARVRCDAQNGAVAEEAFFAVHGRYFDGDCAELPGFVPSPQTLCVVAGTELEFALVTARPDATIACVYDSNPSPGEPPLVCS